MAFADIPESNKKQFAQFLSLSEVPVLFQFLEDHPTRFLVHTIPNDGRFVKVEHTEHCPICASAELKQRFPASYRFRVNVLNITPGVKCPKCGAFYNGLQRVPERCTVDGEPLPKVTGPLNQVQIFEGSKTSFSTLNQNIDMIMATNPKFNILTAVFMASASGQGKQKTSTFMYRPDIMPQENTAELADLGMLQFTDQEILMLCNGTSFKRIMELRKSNANPTEAKLDFASGLSLPGL